MKYSARADDDAAVHSRREVEPEEREARVGHRVNVPAHEIAPRLREQQVVAAERYDAQLVGRHFARLLPLSHARTAGFIAIESHNAAGNAKSPGNIEWPITPLNKICITVVSISRLWVV